MSLDKEDFNAYIGYVQQHVFVGSQTPEGLHELLRAVKQQTQTSNDKETSLEREKGGCLFWSTVVYDWRLYDESTIGSTGTRCKHKGP